MAATERTYDLSANWTTTDLLDTLETALADVGFHGAEDLGIISTFVSTAVSPVLGARNKRYLSAGTKLAGAAGAGALFELARNQSTGGLTTLTLINGGRNWACFAQSGVSSSGTTLTVPDTSVLYAGMVLAKISGTGTLAANTVISSITDATHIVVNRAPTVALSAAVILFADAIKIPYGDIGGSQFTKNVNLTSGSTTFTWAGGSTMANVAVGQVITGTGIDAYVTIASVTTSGGTLSQPALSTQSNITATLEDTVWITLTAISNATNLAGTATLDAATITNVLTTANLYTGAEITILSGTPALPAGRTFISAISGTGPYTVTLARQDNTPPVFNASGSITFKASQGGTSKFFARDNLTNPSGWAVLKLVHNAAKRLGTTYWSLYFNISSASDFRMRCGPGFNPSAKVFNGLTVMDWMTSSAPAAAANYVNLTELTLSNATIGSVAASAFPLTLKTWQSAIDPSFVVFQFIEEATNARSRPFFLGHFDTAAQPWDLDHVFLGGAYRISRDMTAGVNDSTLYFEIGLSALGKRAAEWGYHGFQAVSTTLNAQAVYQSILGSRFLAAVTRTFFSIYNRGYRDWQHEGMPTYNPIIKSIPLMQNWIPSPYTLPAEFVIAEIPSTSELAWGDTLRVSDGEIYKIIQYGNNNGATGAGVGSSIVFGVRTVG